MDRKLGSRFSQTCEFWSSEPNRRLRFSLLSIILTDLLGHKTLLHGFKRSWLVICGFPSVLCVSLFQGSLLVIVIMIDSSDKHNCEEKNGTLFFGYDSLSKGYSVLNEFMFQSHMRFCCSLSVYSRPLNCYKLNTKILVSLYRRVSQTPGNCWLKPFFQSNLILRINYTKTLFSRKVDQDWVDITIFLIITD